MPTYDRPIEAKLYVHLGNGEQFEAKPEDFKKFGYIQPLDAYKAYEPYLRETLAEAGLLTEGQELTDAKINPLRYIMELALFTPDLLNHPEVIAYKDVIVRLERALHEAKFEPHPEDVE